MSRVLIAEHALKHGLTEDDINYAWRNYYVMQQREAPNEQYFVAIGPTRRGQLLQMIAVAVAEGTLVIHAMAPPTKKVLRELGLSR